MAVAAKVDGQPCCDWIGSDGAGHFVKMVHNGIEYGDMQIIAEAYQVMKELMGMDNDAISEVFGRWNNRKLKSYLVEITRDILAYRDADGEAVIDRILDSAGQKGTGKWTAAAAPGRGYPTDFDRRGRHGPLPFRADERKGSSGQEAPGARSGI